MMVKQTGAGGMFFDTQLVALREYWTGQLSRRMEPRGLRTDYPRRAESAPEFGVVPVDVIGETHDKLRQLVGDGAFLLYTTLMASLKLCLYKYTDTSVIVVGSPARRGTAADDTAENALPIVDVVKDSLSFRELLLNVRQTLLDAYERQAYPFDQLVGDAGADRVDGSCPLFDVALVLTDIHAPLPALTNDLTLIFTRQPEHVSGRILYNSALFTAATIERFASHLLALLHDGLTNPNKTVAGLRMTTPDEQRQTLVEWNRTQTDDQPDQSVPELVESQAARTPDAVAVVCGDERLTYAELNARANQLAHHLRAAGVGPETLVGICVERSLDMVVGLTGILKAGGAFVPLDPGYPSERLSFMMNDGPVSVLVTQAHLVERVAAHHAAVICLDTDRDDIARMPTANPRCRVSPGNLAYVIYTSGSTGAPKGVLVSHAGLINLVWWHRRTFAVTARDRATQLAGTAFDASVWEMWPYLTAGASLHVIDHAAGESVGQIHRWLLAQQITVTFLPTPLAERMLPLEWPRPGSLRLMLVGGDRLHRSPTQPLPFTLINNYGPTETTVVATSGPVVERAGAPSIGRPIANAEVYILDRALQPVPVGVPGHLHVGGSGVARGYLQRPEWTAERFIPNPFGAGRLYRTGDSACYLPDGSIEFLGRLDRQVKIRGFRIELGEIDAALLAHPDVLEAVVVARDAHAAGAFEDEKQLVAYLVLREGSGPGAREPWSPAPWRAWLQKKVPDFMVPDVFVSLPSLPLTQNGKVDRRALPAPESLQGDLAGVYRPPRTVTELEVAAVWADVLGISRVGLDDSFFALGGHSLLATQVVSRLRQAWGIDVPLRTVFQAPTLEGFGAAVLPLREGGVRTGTSPCPRADRLAPLPLSHAQERLWFLSHLDEDASPYNIPLALRLRGDLDVPALEASLHALVERHESLRTTFMPGTDGRGPVQAIGDTHVALPLVDLTDLPPAAQEAEIRRLASASAQQHFSLTSGPVLQGRVVRLEPGGGPSVPAAEHVVLLTLHHMVADGWSVPILLREWAALYAAIRQGRPAALPALPLQYADYAVWQRQRLQAGELAASLAYWRQQLAGAPPVLTLPIARPRPAVQSYRGQLYAFTVPPPVAAGLRQVSRASGATLFMTLLAAFQLLLHRYSGQDDVLVGTPIANRTRVELEPLIGLFVNTLVLRTRLAGPLSFRALLAQVHAMTLEAYQHQEVPFEHVVDAVQPQRTLSHTPLVQVMFMLQNAAVPLGAWPGLTLEPLAVEYPVAKLDLALAMEEDGEEVRGRWEFNSDLFDAADIARMSGHFLRLLEAIVANPDQPIETLPLLTTEEYRQLEGWSTRPVAYPEASAVHRLFEAQAERAPQAVALVHGEHQLSYSELNQRSNHLARQLQTHGVGPEVKVAVCLERSPDLIVSVLAILKAGGCYVPLDPTYPQERLDFMLRDTQAPILLTRRHLTPRFERPGLQIVDPAGAEETGHASDLTSELWPDHLAYVIYTSGSTGEPKGVLVQHRSLWNFCLALRDFFGAGPGDRILQFFSANFDGSISDIVLALTSGATLCLVDQDTVTSAEALMRTLRDEAITIARFPPAILNALPSTDFPALRFVGSAGDACTGRLVARWSRGRRFSNGYGPSEGTIGTCIKDCTDTSDERPPIGTPFPNVRVYVLDRNLHRVPVGIPGELYVGGINLARGYLHQPALTAEKFVPNPFNPQPGARLYKTGDIVRYLPNGDLAFLGRADNQVKLRGFRIELGEIQSLLHQHPRVREAVVVTREDQPDHKRLVAYVVPAHQESEPGPPPAGVSGAADSSDLITALRDHLKRKLPDHMLPAAFVTLDALPLSPNGKVDNQALPVPDRGNVLASGDGAPPRTRIEAILTAVWADTLGLARVGIFDDFFELGGHSLLAMQLVSKMSVALQRDVSVKQLFMHPTVAGLAEAFGQPEGLPGPQLAALEPEAGTVPAASLSPPPATRFVRFEDRPLLTLFAANRLAPVDSVVLGYVPSALLARARVGRAAFMRRWFARLPLPNLLLETSWGRIGAILLPWLDTELYSDQRGLVDSIIDALHMAKQAGARTVALAGLLPSATDYGRAVTRTVGDRVDLPTLSTGHATTTSAVVMAIAASLEAGGRELAAERVGFIGLGSIGAATLRLMLACLPHPAVITLCDVHGKRDELASLQRDIVEEHGFRGDVQIATSTTGAPRVLYDATLIVGATNAPDVLDIGRVPPGTIIVDDSAPHCFDPALAVQRFQAQADILVTEGGVLHAPHPISQLLYWHPEWAEVMQLVPADAGAAPSPHAITGCVLSGLLSSRFTELPPTVGPVDAEACRQHYTALDSLGLRAAPLHCRDYVLPDALVGAFRSRFATTDQGVSRK